MLEYVIQNQTALINVVLAAIALASMIAALTPTKADDTIIERIKNVLLTWLGRK